MRTQIALFLAGAALVGFAVLTRVWLAATGGYTDGPLSVPLRAASAIALAAGMLLAAASVAWPLGRGRR